MQITGTLFSPRRSWRGWAWSWKRWLCKGNTTEYNAVMHVKQASQSQELGGDGGNDGIPFSSLAFSLEDARSGLVGCTGEGAGADADADSGGCSSSDWQSDQPVDSQGYQAHSPV